METPPTASEAEPVRILVVDDEPVIANFLRTGLRYEGFEAVSAASGEEALETLRTFKADLVILDLTLPGLDGFEVCRQMRSNPTLGILMLTAKDQIADRVRGLDLGADDYLVKPFDFEELLSRVRAVLRRLKQGSVPSRVVGPFSLAAERREICFRGNPLELTAREYGLLLLFIEHPRQVLARQLILDRVWGADFFGGENNVEVYVGYLRSKLGEEGRHLIQTVRGTGYRLSI